MSDGLMDSIYGEIREVRPATTGEMARMGWENQDPPMVIVLVDGTVLLPASDSEGNEPGVLHVISRHGTYAIYP